LKSALHAGARRPLAIPRDALLKMKLDATTGFLLSLVDGRTSFEDLLHVCAMPQVQAVRLFGALRFLGIEFQERGRP
jgi:hypothetical protein